ncbi:unnamed protein product, partial [Musa banksii]
MRTQLCMLFLTLSSTQTYLSEALPRSDPCCWIPEPANSAIVFFCGGEFIYCLP